MEENHEKTQDVPMVEQYKTDNAIIHANRIVRDVKIIVAIIVPVFMVCLVSLTLIFVSYYSARQREFLNTINMLIPKSTTTVEVQGGNMEQFAPP